MANSIEDALNDCIDRLQRGEGVEQCLARHSALARELRPLLETATAVLAASAVAPRPTFIAATRYRVNAALERQPRRRRWLAWRWGALAATLLVLLAGTAAIPASAEALPDELLYPIKRARERIDMLLPQDDATAAEKRLFLLQRRLDEVEALQERRRPVALPLLAEIADEAEHAAMLLERQPRPPIYIAQGLAQTAARQQAVLEVMARGGPVESREALRQALYRAEDGRERVLLLLDRMDQPHPPTPVRNQPTP